MKRTGWRTALVGAALAVTAAAAPGGPGATILFREITWEEAPGAGAVGAVIGYSTVWPVAGAFEPVMDALRKELRQLWLTGLSGVPADTRNPQELLQFTAERLSEANRSFRKQFPDSATGAWEDHRRIAVASQQRGLLTLSLTYSSYTGGAHGNRGTLYRVFDVRSGRRLTENDVFLPGYEEPVSARIKQAIRAGRELLPDTPLKTLGYLDEQIRPRNFRFAEKGIGFLFNPYDIAPYSEGDIDVVLPYGELAEWLNPTSPVSWMWKTP